MHRILRTAVATVLVVSLGVTPAFAAGPTTSPATFISEGFESGTTPTYFTSPIGGIPASTAWWAPSAKRKRSGLNGLWCSGTNGTTWPYYAADSKGYATFDLSQAADYYESSLVFYYTMPSLGVSDANSFGVEWSAKSVPTSSTISGLPLTTLNGWSRLEYDLTADPRFSSLSRTAGDVVFKWFDQYENFGSPTEGEGVTLDDVAIQGWKYGPVRSLATAVSGSDVTVSWLRPYRAVASTVMEERTIGYRVYRAPQGTSTWSEITPARIVDQAATVSFVDTTAPGGTAYRYAVQVWDATTGYGRAVEVTSASVPARLTQPTAAVIAPAAAATVGGPSAVQITGTASVDPATAIQSVTVRVRRDADGAYWNGSSWQSSVASLTAGASPTLATWSYSWVTPKGELSPVTVSAITRDAAGNSSQAATRSFTLDTKGPSAIHIRQVSAYAIDVRFSEALSAGTVTAGDFVVKGALLRGVSLSTDGTTVRLRTSKLVTGRQVRVQAPAGSFADALGNVSAALDRTIVAR